MEKLCPNLKGCRLVRTEVVISDPEKKASYMKTYCDNTETWKLCKRYLTKRSLWICPDFVLPDSNMSEDEIIDLFEALEKKG